MDCFTDGIEWEWHETWGRGFCGHGGDHSSVQYKLGIRPYLCWVLEDYLVASLCTIHLIFYCFPMVLVICQLMGEQAEELGSKQEPFNALLLYKENLWFISLPLLIYHITYQKLIPHFPVKPQIIQARVLWCLGVHQHCEVQASNVFSAVQRYCQQVHIYNASQ